MSFSFLKKKKYLIPLIALLLVVFFPLISFAVDLGDDVLSPTVQLFAKALNNTVLALCLWISKMFFGISTMIFFWVVEYTIFDFGEHWVGGDGATGAALGGLKLIWQLARDLVNFALVILF